MSRQMTRFVVVVVVVVALIDTWTCWLGLGDAVGAGLSQSKASFEQPG